MIKVHEKLCDYLKQEITCKQRDDCIEVNLPFLDMMNDHIALYVKCRGDSFVVTDDGYVANELYLKGVKPEGFLFDPNTNHQPHWCFLHRDNVKLFDGALEIKATAEEVPDAIITLAQTMMNIYSACSYATDNPFRVSRGIKKP